MHHRWLIVHTTEEGGGLEFYQTELGPRPKLSTTDLLPETPNIHKTRGNTLTTPPHCRIIECFDWEWALTDSSSATAPRWVER